MPLVRFLVDVGGAWAAGSEVELPAIEAAKWADGYRAELVADEPAAELVADEPAVETAHRRPAAERRRRS